MSKNNKIVLCLNIITILILFFIVFLFQKYFYLTYHDYLIPFVGDNIDNLIHSFGRIPGLLLTVLTKNILPDILSIHPQDFNTSIDAFIKSVNFLLICIVVSCGFYIGNNKISYMFRLENIVVLPLIFFLLAMPILLLRCYNMYFGKMIESEVYNEYFFGFLFYFTFFIFLLYMFLKPNRIGIYKKIIIIVCSLLLGLWVEILNVSSLFSIIIFCLLVYFYDRNLIKEKNLIYFCVPFLLGLLLFYLFSSYSSGHYLVSYSYNWQDLLINIKTNLPDFSKYYVKYLFLNVKYFYIIIMILLFLLYKRRNSNINIIILTCISILVGYLMMNLVLSIFREVPTIEYSGFLVQREHYQILYVNVLTFVVFILLGAVFYEYSKFKKHIISVLLILDIILLNIFIFQNKRIQDESYANRMLVNQIEKNMIIYNVLGESAIMPASLLQKEKVFSREIFMFDDKYRFEREVSDYDIDKYSQFMKNHYFDKYYFIHKAYFEKVYKRKFIGFIFVDDDVAEVEYNKRLKLLNINDEPKDKIRKNNISFKSLIKYKGFQLSLSDVENMKVDKDNEDLIVKFKAYIYYRNGNLKEALNLYMDYMKKYPNDFDALINSADICIRLKKVDEAEKMYWHLHNLDNNNLTFLYKLLIIYYYLKHDYKKALDICDLMIDVQKNMNKLYINKAVVYLALSDREKANDIFKKIYEEDFNTLNEFLFLNDIGSIDDLYKKSFIKIFEPVFS